MGIRGGTSGERRGMEVTAMGELGMLVLLCGHPSHPHLYILKLGPWLVVLSHSAEKREEKGGLLGGILYPRLSTMKAISAFGKLPLQHEGPEKLDARTTGPCYESC